MTKQNDYKYKTLFEVCRDLLEHPEFLQDKTGSKLLLDRFIRHELHKMWGDSIHKHFDEARQHLKGELQPVPDLFTDVELRRIIGTEIAWYLERQKDRIPYPPGCDLAKMRNDFVCEVTIGKDPILDEDSPERRMIELETYLRSWQDFPAFGFGVRALENATGGILPGEICVLTGAPGTMKTSLALCAVEDFVLRGDEGLVLYCSVDMAPREITQRLMEWEAQIPQHILASMRARQDPELGKIKRTILEKYNRRLIIKGHGNTMAMTVGDLLRNCLKRQPQLVVIDYLTRLKEPGQSDLEFVELAMPQILSFAHQYETSFLILSQMSRVSRAEQASGHTGGHGRGGGIVEELAHTEIELFHQPVEGNNPLVIAAITKARRGIAGQYFALEYDGPIKRFTGGATKMLKKTTKSAVFEPAADKFYGLGTYFPPRKVS
jgi:KaiC/GvpD/RAD55 family RecA-like ATPase